MWKTTLQTLICKALWMGIHVLHETCQDCLWFYFPWLTIYRFNYVYCITAQNKPSCRKVKHFFFVRRNILAYFLHYHAPGCILPKLSEKYLQNACEFKKITLPLSYLKDTKLLHAYRTENSPFSEICFISPFAEFSSSDLIFPVEEAIDWSLPLCYEILAEKQTSSYTNRRFYEKWVCKQLHTYCVFVQLFTEHKL